MDREACIRAGIDYDEGVARFVGRADMYEKFLAQFPEDPGFSALDEAMGSGDVSAAFQAAHSLKGVSGNLSVNNLYHSLIPFVNALRGAGDLPLAKTLYPPVEEAYRTAIQCIREQRG